MNLVFNYTFWDFWAPYDPANGAYGYHKCVFDGENKKIYIDPEASDVDVREDIYSNWKEWSQVRDNAKFLPAIRATGGDPIGGGQFTGDIYFLINGWQIIIDHEINLTGILFSDDFPSPYIIEFGGVVAKVSSLAIAYNTSGSSGSGITAADIWSYGTRTLTASPDYNGPSVVQIRQEMDTNSIALQEISATVADIDSAVATAPSAVDIADAVRTELTPELDKIMMLESNPGLTPTQATMLLEMYELLGLDPTKPLVVTASTRSAGDIAQIIQTDSNSTVVTRV